MLFQIVMFNFFSLSCFSGRVSVCVFQFVCFSWPCFSWPCFSLCVSVCRVSVGRVSVVVFQLVVFQLVVFQLVVLQFVVTRFLRMGPFSSPTRDPGSSGAVEHDIISPVFSEYTALSVH